MCRRDSDRRRRRGGRFGERSKRVARRKERDTFREVVMPAGYLCGTLGFVGIIGGTFYFAATDRVPFIIIALSLPLIVLPCIFYSYRLVRGHHSDALNEP